MSYLLKSPCRLLFNLRCRANSLAGIGLAVFGLMLVNAVGLGQVQAAQPTTAPEVVLPSAHNQAAAIAANRRLGVGVNLGFALEQAIYVARSKAPGCQSSFRRKSAETKPYEAQNYAAWIQTNEFWQSDFMRKFDSVRLPVAWNLYRCSDGKLDADYLDLVKRVVTLATKNGFVVVLDLHEFNKELRDNPDSVKLKDQFTEIWRHIAENFGEFSARELYFDILNEPQRKKKGSPHLADFCEKHWLDYAVAAADVIASESVGANAENANRPLLIAACNPDDWKDIAARLGAILNVLRTPKNGRPRTNPMIATFHYYDPSDVTHWRQRCSVAKNGRKPPPCGCAGNAADNQPALLDNAHKCVKKNGKPVPYDSERWRKNNKKRFEAVAQFGDTFQVPINLGEFGYEGYLSEKSHPDLEVSKKLLADARVTWVKDIRDRAIQYKMSYTYWNLFASFGYVSQGRDVADKMLHDALRAPR
ncbi:MAG: cellulase family glycosylhydrolase [Burkholderiaceae bacterium]